MKRRLLCAVLLVATAILGSSTSAAAAPSETTTWHRLNIDQSNPAPEHERWQCRTAAVWVCHYDKLPEAGLNFYWDDAAATFVGRDITGTWDCPAYFESRCAAVTQVVEGTSHFRPTGEPPTRFVLEFVVLDDSLLYLVINFPTDDGVFSFACPWYPTFAEALDANPFPLPFNGVDWPADDCIFPSDEA